jgi:hypothetical protein
MKAVFLTLLLCFSCTKYAEVSRSAMGINMEPVQMEISHLDGIDWPVGKKKEETISQSFTFIVDMPKIKQEDLDYLTDHRGINAWILRLIVNHGSETQDLGSLYAYFRPRKVSRGTQSAGATSSVTFKVFYAAAYASERFRSFRCPAFSHNKKIKSLDIKGGNEPFSLVIGQALQYKERSQLVELTPSSFNGGNSLVGEYFVEIAAYDATKKMIHSNFKRIPMHIEVATEESVDVASCQGVRSEIQ